MALTINRQPEIYSTAFNELTFDVSSTNSSLDSFKFIFKLYVNGSYISTSKLPKRPENNCLFDAQSYIKNFVQGVFFEEVARDEFAFDGYSCSFYVEFYEEYLVGGALTESALLDTSDLINCFEMVANRWELPSDELVAKYAPQNPTTTPFNSTIGLLSGPRVLPSESWSLANDGYISRKDTYSISPTDKRSLSILARDEFVAEIIERLRVRTYTNTGEVKIFEWLLRDYSTPTIDITRNISHIPVGIGELNDWVPTLLNIPSGLATAITPGEDVAYSIEIINNVGEFLFKPIIFRIIECTIYEHLVLRYKTPVGGWWYLDCSMKNYQSETTERTTIQVKKQYSDDSTFRENRVVDMDGKASYVVNTDWLPSQEHIQEVVDLLQSPEVYLIKDERTIPVTIKTSQYSVKNLQQDKITQYTIELEDAFDIKLLR